MSIQNQQHKYIEIEIYKCSSTNFVLPFNKRSFFWTEAAEQELCHLCWALSSVTGTRTRTRTRGGFKKPIGPKDESLYVSASAGSWPECLRAIRFIKVAVTWSDVTVGWQNVDLFKHDEGPCWVLHCGPGGRSDVTDSGWRLFNETEWPLTSVSKQSAVVLQRDNGTLSELHDALTVC